MRYFVQQGYPKKDSWTTIATCESLFDAEDIVLALKEKFVPPALEFRFIEEG